MNVLCHDGRTMDYNYNSLYPQKKSYALTIIVVLIILLFLMICAIGGYVYYALNKRSIPESSMSLPTVASPFLAAATPAALTSTPTAQTSTQIPTPNTLHYSGHMVKTAVGAQNTASS